MFLVFLDMSIINKENNKRCTASDKEVVTDCHVMYVRQSEREKERECYPSTDKRLSGS